MTSNNTNQYTYYVAYAHSSGHGMTRIFTAGPMDSWESLVNVSTLIGDTMDIPPVTITNYQLLSGPADVPQVGVPGLYSQVAETVADAEQRLANENTDHVYLAVDLVDTLTQVRDLLAATLPNQ